MVCYDLFFFAFFPWSSHTSLSLFSVLLLCVMSLSVLSKTVGSYAKSVKNVALQYPEIKVKVLEATSNEKWGPTGTQMQEIAAASHSYEHFPLIMQTLWERINDTGKNWRHVYKSLLVLDYLLRSGSYEVVRESRVKMIEIQVFLCLFFETAKHKISFVL